MSKYVMNVMTKRVSYIEIPQNSYTFNISLADNAVDNNSYRCTKQTIFELFEQLNGIYCIDDIFEEAAPCIFETCITESEDSENPDGSYVELSAKAFIPITNKSKYALNILKTNEKNSKNNIIKAGVLFSAKSTSCSICGKSNVFCCHEPRQIYCGKKFYRNIQGVARIDGWYVEGLHKNAHKNNKVDTSYLIKQLEEKLLECQNIIKEIKNV